MKKITQVALYLAISLNLSCCAARNNIRPQTVRHVNLTRYTGLWHEIASFPAFFQRGCTCTNAHYRLLPSGKIEVINRCLKGKQRKLSRAKGKAWVASKDGSNSKLKVQFFWPFSGDYWILYLSKAYQRVIVGTPDHRYLWFLARTRTISARAYQHMLKIAQAKGYDTSRLRRTQQNCTYPSRPR